MKKLNKKQLIIAAVAVIAIAVLLIVLLNNKPKTENKDTKVPEKADTANTAPEITGVADTLSSPADTEIDLLAGVKATDAEDGDLTASIVIESMPAITVTGGKASVAEPGDYELTYTVTDKGGLAAAPAYTTLTVTRKTGEAELYKDFDFSAPYTPDARGWVASINEPAAGTAEMKQGAWVIEVANPGDSDGQVLFCKPGVALKAGADYRVKIWAKSTKDTYAHLLIEDAGTEDWKLFGDAWNVKITPVIAPLEVYFSAAEDATADVRLHLGKITPNPENPADSTPEDFTVTIDKVEFYEITGEEHEVALYTADFADETAVAISAGDGAEATAAAGTYTLTAYPTSGGVWSIKADLPLKGVQVEAGKKYFYRFTVTAENAQGGECLVESAELADKARANFNGLSIPAGEETVITNVFTADGSVSDPVIRMQIGNPNEGVTANTLTVKDLVFGEMQGNKAVDKTIDNFGMTIAADANPDYIWSVFNGTDEENDLGVGTVWTENGHLFYRIDQGAPVDYFNKLFFGHGKSELILPADSYFVVEVTGKATKPVSCAFFLNAVGKWEPRLTERIDFTTEEQTFTFETTDTLILDMPFEMLFQFGSQQTVDAGEVTIELSSVKILQKKVN